MSPMTSAATISWVYDVQRENLRSSQLKSSSTSVRPTTLFQAPKTVTGSLRVQISRRGVASPLCTAGAQEPSPREVDLTNARFHLYSDRDREVLEARLSSRRG